MIQWTMPTDDSPEALYRWVVEFVQQQRAEQEGGANASGGGGSANETPVIVGGCVFWPGTEVPSGYFALSGQLLPKLSYPGLYGAFGDRWNEVGDAADSFRLPDANNRVPLQNDELYGGDESQTLGLEHLPALALDVTDPQHSHAFTGTPHNHAVTDPQHSHGMGGANVLVPSAVVAVAAGAVNVQTGSPAALVSQNSPTGISLASTAAGGTNAASSTGIEVNLPGGGDPFSLIPPFFGGLWIVRAQ